MDPIHTLILLSRQGTQAVVTCLRGAFFGFSGSGDMAERVLDHCLTMLEIWIKRGGGNLAPTDQVIPYRLEQSRPSSGI